MAHTDKAAKQFLVLTVQAYRMCPTIVNLLHGFAEFKSELSLVNSQSMYSAQFDIARVFHCEGLLLCTSADASRFVVWNPFTGETRWFQHSSIPGCVVWNRVFFLGYYKEDNNKRYKILSFDHSFHKYYEIYEFSSDSWRTLNDIIPSDWSIADPDLMVSLKGNTYWYAEDETEKISLLKFDFQTEKSVPVSLPYQCDYFESRGLSVVREEKLSLLLQRYVTSKTEIWVTDKIDDETTTQVVSWSKILALDLMSQYLQTSADVNFLLDEEKKVVMMSLKWFYWRRYRPEGKNMIYTVGEDNEVTEVELGTYVGCPASFLNYVPSLVQIEQTGRKRKRGDLSKK